MPLNDAHPGGFYVGAGSTLRATPGVLKTVATVRSPRPPGLISRRTVFGGTLHGQGPRLQRAEPGSVQIRCRRQWTVRPSSRRGSTLPRCQARFDAGRRHHHSGHGGSALAMALKASRTVVLSASGMPSARYRAMVARLFPRASATSWFLSFTWDCQARNASGDMTEFHPTFRDFVPKE